MNNSLARDPENETLRKTVKERAADEIPNLEKNVVELMEKTSRLHAGFLFDESRGVDVLRTLCLSLSSAKNSYSSPGWEDFGILLGLNPMLIKCICHQFRSEDPTYYTLLAYVQQQDATIDKIVSALKNMGRYDVINMTYIHILGLADDVLGSNVNNEESGYFSLQDEISNIIRPISIPIAPFIFREIVSQRLPSQPYSKFGNSNIEDENYSTAVITTRPSRKMQYGRKVLLTFASDGLHAALQVATEFRKKRDNMPPIGVVILNEHSDLVNNNDEQFISCCFHQVDYVVPIITENYLRAIASNDCATGSSVMCMDTKYIKYIYTLMSTYYLRNGCINDKIRCVIPDSLVYLTQRHPIMARPLFQVWVRASEAEQLSHRILRSRF